MICVIRVGRRSVAFTLGNGSIQSEELGDSYADRSKGERRTEPSQECSFYSRRSTGDIPMKIASRCVTVIAHVNVDEVYDMGGSTNREQDDP